MATIKFVKAIKTIRTAIALPAINGQAWPKSEPVCQTVSEEDCCLGTGGTGDTVGTMPDGTSGNCCDLFIFPRTGGLCAHLTSSDIPCLNGLQLTLPYHPGAGADEFYAGIGHHTCGSPGGLGGSGTFSVGIVRPCRVQIAMVGAIPGGGGGGGAPGSTGSASLIEIDCASLDMRANVTMTSTPGQPPVADGVVHVRITEGAC